MKLFPGTTDEYGKREIEPEELNRLIGSIERGKYADLIVLDRNLPENPVDDISEAEVLSTVLSGRVEYER